MAPSDWSTFYRLTKDNPPSPLLTRAVERTPGKGRALDLGAGAGSDTRYLLEQGFEVTAVDADPGSVAILSVLPQGRLRLTQSRFEDFDFAAAGPYDLINAQYTLPFIPRDHFAAVFTRLKAALAPGGVFAGQFFGVHDQWNTPDRDMTFFTRAEAESLLSDLETIEFAEEDADGQIADGSPKHWHIFHILAHRPASH